MSEQIDWDTIPKCQNPAGCNIYGVTECAVCKALRKMEEEAANPEAPPKGPLDAFISSKEEVGISYLWCPFCKTEWEEKTLQDTIIKKYQICKKCRREGHTEAELTPKFWEDLQKKRR